MRSDMLHMGTVRTHYYFAGDMSIITHWRREGVVVNRMFEVLLRHNWHPGFIRTMPGPMPDMRSGPDAGENIITSISHRQFKDPPVMILKR